MVGPVETIMLASHWVMASTSTFLCTWTPESWQGWHWKTGVRVGWNWTIQHHWHLWAGLRRTSTWYPYLGPTASGCFSRFERLLYQEEWRTRFEIEVDLWFVLQKNLFGLALLLNPLWLAFVFLLLCLTPASSNKTETEWWRWAVPYRKCQKIVTYESGIICANYGVTRCRW